MRYKGAVFYLQSPVVLFCFCITLLFPLRATGAAEGLSLHDMREVPTTLVAWHEDSSRFEAFNAASVYQVIGTGCREYIAAGMRQGFVQDLVGPANTSARITCLDFGTAEKARLMIDKKREGSSAAQMIPAFKKSEAFGERMGSGCIAYYVSGKWYFEAFLTGYDKAEQAFTEASKILQVKKKKLDPLSTAASTKRSKMPLKNSKKR